MSSPSRVSKSACAVILGLLIAFAPLSNGDEVQDRRTRAGVRLFRSLLSADLDLTKKTTPANELLIVFVAQNRRSGEELSALFLSESKEKEKLRGMPIVSEISPDAALAAYAKRVPAGIFICEPLNKPALAAVIRYGIEHHVVVYSPYEGHVESGVLGGLSVEAQVRPFVNQATLQASQISLKQFFLEVAKVHR
jgi:hypothetical protein